MIVSLGRVQEFQGRLPRKHYFVCQLFLRELWITIMQICTLLPFLVCFCAAGCDTALQTGLQGMPGAVVTRQITRVTFWLSASA